MGQVSSSLCSRPTPLRVNPASTLCGTPYPECNLKELRAAIVAEQGTTSRFGRPIPGPAVRHPELLSQTSWVQLARPIAIWFPPPN